MANLEVAARRGRGKARCS